MTRQRLLSAFVEAGCTIFPNRNPRAPQGGAVNAEMRAKAAKCCDNMCLCKPSQLGIVIVPD